MFQILINGLVVGSQYALTALGFALIYGVVRFFHFSHGAVYLLAAYVYYWLGGLLHLPIYAAAGLAVFFAALAGSAIEISLYRPLRWRHTNSKGLLLASLGFYVLVQNAISLSFGDATQTLRGPIVMEGVDVLGARVTPLQMLILSVAIALLGLTAWFLYRTTAGKQIRAVASDPELAIIVGTANDRVHLVTFALGSLLAGVAAVLVSMDTDIYPTMGFHALLMSVVAVVVGGRGSLAGAVIAGLLVGIVQHLGAWLIGSQWQDVLVFVVFIAFLVFRPSGIWGAEPRTARV